MADDICARLAEPFDPSLVSWRVGPTTKDKSKGMALAYIDARDVMRRLDEICGPENWQDEYPWSDGKRVVCRIGVRIGGEWIWKTDGAGDTDTEGEKGALSDAFKRSAVKWGIGRYLYDVDSPWVQIEQRGNSYVIAEGEYAKLRARLPRPGGARATETPRTMPPVNPEEPPEVGLARAEMKRLIREFRTAVTEEAISDPQRGIWARNKETIAKIHRHGGEAAIDALNKEAQQRIDELREARVLA